MNRPIVIRGHHIWKYQRLYRSQDPVDPTDAASNVARSVAREFESPVLRNRKYAIDTMGTPEREEEYRKQTQALYERYLNAPENHEVIVVSSEPDDICQLCSFGNHCIKRVRKSLYNELLDSEPYKSQLRSRNYADIFRDHEECYFKGFCDAYNHLYKWEHIKRPSHIEEVTLRFIDCYYPVRARRVYTDKISFQWAAGLMDHYAKYYFPWYIY